MSLSTLHILVLKLRKNKVYFLEIIVYLVECHIYIYTTFKAFWSLLITKLISSFGFITMLYSFFRFRLN